MAHVAPSRTSAGQVNSDARMGRVIDAESDVCLDVGVSADSDVVSDVVSDLVIDVVIDAARRK